MRMQEELVVGLGSVINGSVFCQNRNRTEISVRLKKIRFFSVRFFFVRPFRFGFGPVRFFIFYSIAKKIPENSELHDETESAQDWRQPIYIK